MMKRQLLASLVLALALPTAGASEQAPNLLMPRLRPVTPGETPSPKLEERASETTATSGTDNAPPSHTAAPADASGLPKISVKASEVKIGAKDKDTFVYFSVAWSVDAPEPVAQVEGDLTLSDNFGEVRARAPWTLKNPAGLAPHFDERDVGVNISTSGAAEKWFKGALPSSIHFGYRIREVRFVSGKSLKAGGDD